VRQRLNSSASKPTLGAIAALAWHGFLYPLFRANPSGLRLLAFKNPGLRDIRGVHATPPWAALGDIPLGLTMEHSPMRGTGELKRLLTANRPLLLWRLGFVKAASRRRIRMNRIVLLLAALLTVAALGCTTTNESKPKTLSEWGELSRPKF
jgi:hypothetical protein